MYGVCDVCDVWCDVCDVWCDVYDVCVCGVTCVCMVRMCVVCVGNGAHRMPVVCMQGCVTPCVVCIHGGGVWCDVCAPMACSSPVCPVHVMCV